MATSRPRGSLLAVTLAAAVLGAGCYSQQGPLQGGRGVLFADGPVADLAGAPRARVLTEYEASGVSRVRTRLRVDDDAYVLVVNVGPDGSARIVFPDSPKDRGFLRGGQTYALSPFFSGYPTIALASTNLQTRFVRYQHSSFARTASQGPGYTFILASRRPFDVVSLEDAGLFDGVDVGSSVHELSPESLIPAIAELAVGGMPDQPVRANWARYAGYDPIAGARAAMYASSSMYASAGNYCSYGYVTRWAQTPDPMFSPYDRMCPGGVYLGPPTTRPPTVQRPDSTSDSTAVGDDAKRFRPRSGSDTTGTGGAVDGAKRFRPRNGSDEGTASRSFRARFSPLTATAPAIGSEGDAVELTPESRPRMRRRDAFLERRMAREPARTKVFEPGWARGPQRAASAPRTSASSDGLRDQRRLTGTADAPSPRTSQGKAATPAASSRPSSGSSAPARSGTSTGGSGPEPPSRVKNTP